MVGLEGLEVGSSALPLPGSERLALVVDAAVVSGERVVRLWDAMQRLLPGAWHGGRGAAPPAERDGRVRSGAKTGRAQLADVVTVLTQQRWGHHSRPVICCPSSLHPP